MSFHQTRKNCKKFTFYVIDQNATSLQSAKITEAKAPAKRLQHANTTYRDIVGHNMLCACGHRVGMCCDMFSSLSQHVATHRNAVAKCVGVLPSFGRGLKHNLLTSAM